MNVFETVKGVSESQLHVKFKQLRDDPYCIGEKTILQQWVDGLKDRDHKMLHEFQTTFHASFWEFYLYACFKEAGFILDQNHNRPDFMIQAPYEVNIEAVVANIRNNGRSESDRNLNDLMDMFTPPKNQVDFFNIQHEAIVRQSNAITSKIKKFESDYSKCSWVKDNVPFVIAVSSYSQVNYGREFIYPMLTLLYGKKYIPQNGSFEEVEKIKKPGTDSTIPVGLFCSDKYSEISAVLYSCTTTLGKLTSLAISNGYVSQNEVHTLRKDFEKDKTPYTLQKVGVDLPEYLTEGLFLFHNPFAKNRLDIKCFENTLVAQFYVENNKIKHKVNNCPIVSRLNFPILLSQGFYLLMHEYLRQYNEL